MEELKTIKNAKYWVYDNGAERRASYKEFRYWYDNFCSSVMDKHGDVYDKGKISIRSVDLIYNPFGIGVAGRNN